MEPRAVALIHQGSYGSTTAPNMDGDDQPTTPNQGLNFARANAKRVATRAARWDLWQSEAEAIWAQRPDLSRAAVATLVKRRLQVSEQADSIARRIRK